MAKPGIDRARHPRARSEALSSVALKSLPEAHRKAIRAARRDIMAEVDLVILCLPDAAAKESAALADGLGNAAPKLLDASTAHRVDPAWDYGFPEMIAGQSERIAASARVANPGCYPTGAIGLDPAAGRCRADPGGLSDHDQRGERLFGRRQVADRGA